MGTSVLANTTVTGTLGVTGTLTGNHASFNSIGVSGPVSADRVLTDWVGESDALRTVYFDGPGFPYIGQFIGPNVSTMITQEDLGIGQTTLKYISMANRNIMTQLQIDNQTNPMRLQFGSAPLSLRIWPKQTGFDTYDNWLECYKEDSSEIKAAIRHDGSIWGPHIGFKEDMKTQVRTWTAPYGSGTVDWLRFVVNESIQADILPDQAVFYEKLVAPNVNSSGSVTHCHVCEPED